MSDVIEAAAKVLCDDYGPPWDEAEEWERNMHRATAAVLHKAGMLATREEWTIQGTNTGEGWQLELEWDNREEAQVMFDSEPWIREKGGRLVRRRVSEWREVAE